MNKLLNFLFTDLKIRYISSRLGFFWFFFHPLLLFFAYLFIFENFFTERFNLNGLDMNYSIYILSGLILWFSFLESFTKGSEIFIEYSNLLKKQYIPFNYLFCTSFFSGLFIGILYLILLNIVVIFGDYIYSLIWTILFSLLVFFISLFGSILGFFYAILNLVIFDLKHLKPIILFILFWSTPIIYPQFILDNAMQSIVKLNPLSYFVNLARDILQGKLIYNEFIYLFFFTLLAAILFIIFLKNNATFIRDNV